MQTENLTSQLSRMKQRPPATDLSGPKASEESLTPRSRNLAPDVMRDTNFCSLSMTSPALGFKAMFDGSECGAFFWPKTDRSRPETEGRPVPRTKELDVLVGKNHSQTAGSLVVRSRESRRWRSRGTDLKIRSRFRRTWYGQFSLALVLGRSNLAPCFASFSLFW